MRKILTMALLMMLTLVLFLTVAASATTETVLYVSDAGTASGTGTAGSPINSLSVAISKLPDSGGTIVICGDLTITEEVPSFPAKTGKVTVTGSYGGTDYNPTIKLSAAANMIMQFQSEIEFNNLTFNRTGDYYTEFTTGPSLTIGENVTFLDDGAAMTKGGGCMMIRLGYSNAVSSLDKKCDSAFLRMESGTVNYIQGGNKWNDVGAARIEIVGPATVTDNIQCGGTNFDVDTVELSIQGNANIPIVYAGGYGKDSSHAGTVGSVTIGAGNSTINKLYANRSEYYSITTKLNIVLNNTSVGGFNMGGGTIESAAKVYLQFKNQSFFTCTNVLSWVDTLKVLENSTVYIDADYAGPASATVTEGSNLYLSPVSNTSSDLPTNAETTSPGTIALYSGQDLPTGTPITMYYDDRLDVSKYSQVFITAKGTPTSYQVGYGVTANSVKDTAVITYDSSKKQLIATGIGSAWVVLGEERIKVTVTAAPISMFFMIGQSNMAGNNGNPNLSVVCPEGQVYSTMAPPGASWATLFGYDGMESLTTATGPSYVASALAGSYSTTNQAGTTTNLSLYPLNSLSADGKGKTGLDSGFAYEWNKLTGEKVWVINAAHGGTSMGDWLYLDDDANTGKEYRQAATVFDAALKTMTAEVKAGHYTLEHYAYFWCQGCADRIQTTDWYLDKFSLMHERLKTDFACDFGDGKGTRTLESANIVLVRACGEDGMNSQEDAKKKDYWTYHDLEMNGVRTAQYYMGNSTEDIFKDVFVVSNIGDQWVYWDEAKTQQTTGEFFAARYPNGIDYKIQSGTISVPTKPEDVRGGDGDGNGEADSGIHYNQIGHNENGREAARNAVYRMYPELAPDEDVSIKLYAWDGVTDLAGKTDTEPLTEYQTIVPVVYPLYRSKELVLSGDMLHDYSKLKGTDTDYSYYSIDGCQEGTVTATLGSVSVTYNLKPSGINKTFRWEIVDGVFTAVTGDGLTKNTLKKLTGTNTGSALTGASFRLSESVVLRHDQPWKVEWKGALHGNAGDGKPYFLLASSCSTNTLDAPNIIVADHSVILNRRLDDGTTYTTYDSAPYAKNYFRHLRAKATIDLATTHTYMLVNEVAADGSNMVYLYIDGVRKAAMNLLVSDGTNLGTNTWMSGKDFVFSHIGTKSAGLSNVTDSAYGTYDYTLTGTLNYMEIAENRLVKTEAVAATCTSDGCKEYYTDPITGKIYADANGTQETTLAALKISGGHTMTENKAVEATCTTAGNSAYWYCKVCDGYFSDAAGNTAIEKESWVIAAGHTMSNTYTNDDAGHWYACTKCDYTEGYAVHGYNTTNCAETATCTVCGYGKAAGSHIWSEWTESEPASCVRVGLEVRECTACGEQDSQPIPMTAHSLTAHEAKTPTCEEDGNSAYWSCDICGSYFADADGAEVIDEFSWIREGGHEIVHVPAVAPTCTEDGNIAHYKCSTCGTLFQDDMGTIVLMEEDVFSSMLFHDYEASWCWAGDCSLATVTFTCVNGDCGYSFDVELEPTISDSKTNSCIEDGYVTYEAVFDGVAYARDTKTVTIPAHGLTAVSAQPATCATDGNLAYWYCQTCDVYYKDANASAAYGENEWVIPGGHELTHHEAQGSNCTDDGNVEYWSCSECGCNYGENDPFATEVLDSVVDAADGHDMTYYSAVAPGKTTAGNIEYWYCSVCGKYFTDAEGENQVSQADTVLAPTSRWGDADRNGEITENDAIVIKLYRAGLITEDDLDLEVCDLDNNGKIDAYDAYLIQIYVEGVITLFPVEVYG